jgi:hypothetical protein
VEDLHTAAKIYVLTRSDVLTEPESLAVFCALNLNGPNTLLWAVFGDEAKAGEVVQCAPGFLRVQLGRVDDVHFAPLGAWLPVLENAWRLLR